MWWIVRVFLRRLDPGFDDLEDEQEITVHLPRIDHFALQVGIALGDERGTHAGGAGGREPESFELIDLPSRTVPQATTFSAIGTGMARTGSITRLGGECGPPAVRATGATAAPARRTQRAWASRAPGMARTPSPQFERAVPALPAARRFATRSRPRGVYKSDGEVPVAGACRDAFVIDRIGHEVANTSQQPRLRALVVWVSSVLWIGIPRIGCGFTRVPDGYILRLPARTVAVVKGAVECLIASSTCESRW